MANKFPLAEAFTEFTIKGWTQFKTRMVMAKKLAMTAMAPFRLLGRAIRKVFSPVGLLAGIAGGAGIFGLAKLASSAEETQNRFEQVFKGIEENAEEFVVTFAKTIDRSADDIRNSMATVGMLFRGLGFSNKEALSLAETIERIARDLASFADLTDAEASRRLIAAMAGSVEVMDRFGVSLRQGALEAQLVKQGITGGIAGATEQQKVLARILATIDAIRRANVMGDLVRTGGSFANQWKAIGAQARDFAILLGKTLMPIFKALLDLGRAILDAFTRWVSGPIAAAKPLIKAIADIIHGMAATLRDVDFGNLGSELWRIFVAAGEILLTFATAFGNIIFEAFRRAAQEAVFILLTALNEAVPSLVSKPNTRIADHLAPFSSVIANEMQKALFKSIAILSKMPGAGGGAKGEAQKARDELAKGEVVALESLAQQISAIMKGLPGGKAGAGKRGGGFASLGFAEVAGHFQQLIGKKDDEQIKLMKDGNNVRGQILGELKKPKPALAQ